MRLIERLPESGSRGPACDPGRETGALIDGVVPRPPFEPEPELGPTYVPLPELPEEEFVTIVGL